MLIVGRFEGESIMIGDDIEIKVESFKKGKVMLAIEAPREIPICRKENYEGIEIPDPGDTL